MTVYDVGDYRVQQLNNAWRVSWQGPMGNRHHLDLDLPAILRQHIEQHLNKICHLVFLMEQDNPDALLNDAMGLTVIMQMPHSDTIPGKHLQEHEIREWHRVQLLKGYNRTNQTNFTYDMIRDRLP